MSSSLFDSCYNGYVSYPKTYNVDGDKTFEELTEGDILYYYITDFFIDELIVTGKLKQYKGNLILPVKGLHNKKCINFGPINCHNVSVFAPKNSIIEYLDGLIGTNKTSVLIHRGNFLNDELQKCQKEYNRLKFSIEKINAEMTKL